jgi:hypothetical protein
MLNYRLFQKLKRIEKYEFNHLIIIIIFFFPEITEGSKESKFTDSPTFLGDIMHIN